MAYNSFMPRVPTKDDRLHLRVDAAAKRKLLDASAYEHQSVGDFVMSHALSAAERIIEEHQTIALAAPDWEAFYAALEQPPAPTLALRAGFRRYRERQSIPR